MRQDLFTAASRPGSRLGRSALARLRQTLTDQDLKILTEISKFRLLTHRQIQLLHFGNTDNDARAARRCMQRLHTSNLLTRLQRRIGGVRAGSDGYVYSLGPAGQRLLHPDRPRPRQAEVRDGFLRHTLAIADIYVALHEASQRGQLEIQTVATEPTCWRRLDGAGGSEWLKPDLLVALTTATNEHHSFVEVDQGTEHAPAIARKLRQYELAYHLGVTAVSAELFPRVVWLVPDERRAELLSRVIGSQRDATPGLNLIALQRQAVAALTAGEVGS